MEDVSDGDDQLLDGVGAATLHQEGEWALEEVLDETVEIDWVDGRRFRTAVRLRRGSSMHILYRDSYIPKMSYLSSIRAL